MSRSLRLPAAAIARYTGTSELLCDSNTRKACSVSWDSGLTLRTGSRSVSINAGTRNPVMATAARAARHGVSAFNTGTAENPPAVAKLRVRLPIAIEVGPPTVSPMKNRPSGAPRRVSENESAIRDTAPGARAPSPIPTSARAKARCQKFCAAAASKVPLHHTSAAANRMRTRLRVSASLPRIRPLTTQQTLNAVP